MADDAEANTEERPNNGNEFEINELNTKLDQFIAGRKKSKYYRGWTDFLMY